MRFSLCLAVVVSAACSDGEMINPLRPRLAAEQSELHLGPTDVGVAVVAAASFSNVGEGDARLLARLSGGEGTFELLDTTGTASPGAPVHFRIRFTPSAPGTIQAALHVQHDAEPDAQGNRTLTVSLRGTANALTVCDDGNACTTDLRDHNAPAGCVFIPIRGECDDGDACTEADTCLGGRCVGRAVRCDDGVECTADVCDPQSGACQHLGVALHCDDSDACSVDRCDPPASADATGCVHQPQPNGTLCGAVACGALPLCVQGQCVVTAAPDGYPCDDGDVCSAGDTCQAGVCLPGADSGPALGEPRVVAWTPPPPPRTADEAALDPVDLYSGSIGGHWPTHVDAVVEYTTDMLDPGVSEPSSFILWRGATEAGLRNACRPGATNCLDAPTCFESPDSALVLHATRVERSGQILSDATLDLNAVFVSAATDVFYGAFASQFGIPAASVAAVAAVQDPMMHAVYGAALVSYGSQCACAQPADGPDGASSSSGGPGTPPVPPPTCLPAGDVRVIFLVQDGAVTPLASRWLGPTNEWSPADQITSAGAGDTRLLDVALDGPRLAVTWLAQDSVATCAESGGDEPCLHQLWANSEYYLLSVAGLGTGGWARFPLTNTDSEYEPVRRIHTRFVDGALVLTMIQQAPPVPPLCGSQAPPGGTATYVALDSSAQSPAAAVLGSNAVDAVATQDSVGRVNLVFSETPLNAPQCQYEERLVVDRNGVIRQFAMQASDLEFVTASASLGSAGGTALLASMTHAGTLHLTAATELAPTHIGAVDFTGALGSVELLVAPAIGSLGHVPAVAALVSRVFTAGDRAFPVMALTTVQCQLAP